MCVPGMVPVAIAAARYAEVDAPVVHVRLQSSSRFFRASSTFSGISSVLLPRSLVLLPCFFHFFLHGFLRCCNFLCD